MAFFIVVTDAIPELRQGTRVELPQLATEEEALRHERRHGMHSTGPRTAFELGREHIADLRISYGVSRRHARLVAQPGLAILDLGSADGTWVNGTRTPPRQEAVFLNDGDYVALGEGIVFRFFRTIPPQPFDAFAEHEVISADPSNASAWAVWADSLLERNDQLGAWILQGVRTPAELARALGPLGAAPQRGLVANWNPFGFLHSLGLSAFPRDGTNTPWVLRNLNLVRAASFLVSLEITLENDEELANVLLALTAAPLPRSLRRLQITRRPQQLRRGQQPPPPLPSVANPELLSRALAALAERCPGLEPQLFGGRQ